MARSYFTRSAWTDCIVSPSAGDRVWVQWKCFFILTCRLKVRYPFPGRRRHGKSPSAGLPRGFPAAFRGFPPFREDGQDGGQGGVPAEEDQFVSRLQHFGGGRLDNRPVHPDQGEQDDAGVVPRGELAHPTPDPRRRRGKVEYLDHLPPEELP